VIEVSVRFVFVFAVATWLLAAAVVPSRAAQPASAPEHTEPVRVAAEWEPATGVLIGWPFKLPRGLLVEMAKDLDLYVTVSNKAARRRAHTILSERHVDPARVHYIITEQSDGFYLPRDWGPFAVFDSDGRSRLVDGRYRDYLAAAAGSNQPLISLRDHFGLDYSLDDNAPGAVAKELGWPRVELPAAVTGGNLFFDGMGTAFATQILVDENANMGISHDKLLRIMETELGVVRFHVLPNFEGIEPGIQHIDCILKLLDEERILIKRPPANHPDYQRIESIVAQLAKLTTPYGRPYTLLRIDTPRYDRDDLANYTNSIILNRKIFVPLFGISADQRALKTWRAAMTGYEVFGFALDKNLIDLRYMDAIHCRTRAVWDQKMLWMTHKRIEGRMTSDSGYPVEAEIRDYSGAGLIEDRLRCYWRTLGSPKWTEVRLEPGDSAHVYRATIEGIRAGQTVEYYLSAASRSGRQESLPRTAPKGFYSFKVVANR
jgi:agmatine/peptidylarginine deiminase